MQSAVTGGASLTEKYKYKQPIPGSVKPDIIHSWSSLASCFLIPALLSHRVKFINGIIADAPLNLGYSDKMYMRAKLTYPLSDIVISNSKAGLKSYDAPLKKISMCLQRNRFQAI